MTEGCLRMKKQAFFLGNRTGGKIIGGTFLKNRVKYTIICNEIRTDQEIFVEKGGHLYEQKINRTFG